MTLARNGWLRSFEVLIAEVAARRPAVEDCALPARRPHMANLYRMADSVGEHRASAIFLHGLGGDAFGTWGGSDAQLCWLGWLAKGIKGLAVGSVGYGTPIPRWRGSAGHLTPRAPNAPCTPAPACVGVR